MQHLAQGTCHSCAAGPCPHLRDDDQPGVDGDAAEAVLQRRLHVRRSAVVEPQREDAQYVLQVVARPGACRKDCLDRVNGWLEHTRYRLSLRQPACCCQPGVCQDALLWPTSATVGSGDARHRTCRKVQAAVQAVPKVLVQVQ